MLGIILRILIDEGIANVLVAHGIIRNFYDIAVVEYIHNVVLIGCYMVIVVFQNDRTCLDRQRISGNGCRCDKLTGDFAQVLLIHLCIIDIAAIVE